MQRIRKYTKLYSTSRDLNTFEYGSPKNLKYHAYSTQKYRRHVQFKNVKVAKSCTYTQQKYFIIYIKCIRTQLTPRIFATLIGLRANCRALIFSGISFPLQQLYFADLVHTTVNFDVIYRSRYCRRFNSKDSFNARHFWLLRRQSRLLMYCTNVFLETRELLQCKYEFKNCGDCVYLS